MGKKVDIRRREEKGEREEREGERDSRSRDLKRHR